MWTFGVHFNLLCFSSASPGGLEPLYRFLGVSVHMHVYNCLILNIAQECTVCVCRRVSGLQANKCLACHSSVTHKVAVPSIGRTSTRSAHIIFHVPEFYLPSIYNANQSRKASISSSTENFTKKASCGRGSLCLFVTWCNVKHWSVQ